MFGILGNPFVTLAYLAEQVNVFVFGSTTRASDLRIFLNVLLNCILVAIITILPAKIPTLQKNHEKYLLTLLVAYLASTNLIYTCGIK